MKVEHAEIADIALLTELRLAYLKEDYGDLSRDDIERIRRDLPGYFEKNLNRNIFCYLIRDKGEVAACAFLLVIEKLLSEAVERNLCVVELKSTEDGHHLYQSVGFQDEVSQYHSMKWYNVTNP